MYDIIKGTTVQPRIMKGMPVPARRNKWPWRLMDVGDMVEIRKNLKKAQSAAHVYGYARGRKFITKIEGSILKVWRVE